MSSLNMLLLTLCLTSGKSFNLTITVHTSPLMVTVYTKCIKVAINDDYGH